MTRSLISYDDVVDASHRLKGVAHRTPVLTSRLINEALDAEVFFKCENFQRIGAFKFRGAYNAIAKITADMQGNGVVTFSSGNHAQAVALAAKLLGITATVVMPLDAPASKVEATKNYGARIIFHDRYTEDREALIRSLADNDGSTIILPFDDPDVIAGQGTAAKELFEEVGSLDAFFVPLGGGGLLAGCALSAHVLAPACKIYGVEPEAGNDGQRSFRADKIITIPTPRTIADGAQTRALGKHNFAIIRKHVTDILTAPDQDLIESMKTFLSHMKMVVEPTGCLGFAAAHNIKEKIKGKRIGVLISGGNIDLDRLSALI